MGLQVKRDTRLFVLWLVVIVGIGYLFAAGKVDWTVATALLITLGLPSLLGARRRAWSDSERQRRADAAKKE